MFVRGAMFVCGVAVRVRCDVRERCNDLHGTTVCLGLAVPACFRSATVLCAGLAVSRFVRDATFFVVLAAPFCDLALRWFVCVSTFHVRCDGLCAMRRVRCYGFVFERVLGFDPQTYLPLLRLCVLIVLRIFFRVRSIFFSRSTFP